MKNDPSRHWTMLSPFVPGEFLTVQAQQAEAAGLAGIAAPEFYGNPLVPLSHCGAVTSRVQLLSAISLALVHNPFTVAMSAMDIDRLSGGRFVLGLGPSAREMVEGFHGVAGYDRPLARLREAIEVIRLLIAIWSVDWALCQGRSTLADTLQGAGRDRATFHWQAGFFVAVTSDPKQAIQDAKPTIAQYAGVAQYEPFFAAHGFGAEAKACQAAVDRHDYARAGAAAVTDDMAATFVIAGSADECRRRLEPMWAVADSFLLVPPFLEVPLDRLINYTLALADTFYA